MKDIRRAKRMISVILAILLLVPVHGFAWGTEAETEGMIAGEVFPEGMYSEEIPVALDGAAPEEAARPQENVAPETVLQEAQVAPAAEAPVNVEETPAAEVPTVVESAPAAEISVVEEAVPVTEAPVIVEEIPAAEAPSVVEVAPVTEAPAVVEEIPAAEAPAVVAEVPATEAPAAVAEVPATEAPAAVEEAPATEAPVVVEEAPATETPSAVEEAPVAEVPAADEEVPGTLPADTVEEAPITEAPANEADIPETAEDTAAATGEEILTEAPEEAEETEEAADPETETEVESEEETAIEPTAQEAETLAAEEETTEEELTEAQSEEEGLPGEEECFEIQGAVTDDGEIPSNGELFAGYVNNAFYPQGTRYYGNASGASLTGEALIIYNYLKEKVAQIASGELAGTQITIPLASLGLKTSYTAEELGIINPVLFQTMARSNYSSKVSDIFGRVLKSLRYDCPYEMYWYDATKGYTINVYAAIQSSLKVTAIEIKMYVASEYAPGQAAGGCTVDTAKLATVRTAVAKAKAIVAKYASASDVDKLKGYRSEICGLASYNGAAAFDTSLPYGNPWQLVWVFDGNASTTVVCEGYAKAFQYLCDLTSFSSGMVESRLVSGFMGTARSAHMWNVVTMNDGKNYLVDVTNCDTGTVGADTKLFLAGASGSVDAGYVVASPNMPYSYDLGTIQAYPANKLELAPVGYSLSSPATVDVTVGKPEFQTVNLALEGKIHLNFFISVPAAAETDSTAHMKFDYVTNGKNVTEKVPLNKAVLITKKGDISTYCFGLGISAAELTRDVRAQFVYQNGSKMSIATTCSVENYAKYVIGNPNAFNARLVRLMKAMLNYGGYIQRYVYQSSGRPYTAQDLANRSLSASDKAVSGTESLLSIYKPTATKGKDDGIAFSGFSLALNSETCIQLDYTLTGSKTIEEYTFKVDGNTVTPVKLTVNGKVVYRVKIPNIKADELAIPHTITAGSHTIKNCSALSYCWNVLSQNLSEELCSVAQAIYQYYRAAVEYNG